MNASISTRRCALALAVLFASPGLSGAEDEQSQLWNQLRGLVTGESRQLEEVLASQAQAESADAQLRRQLEESRQLRQLHREALFIATLNVAWIRDQLEHWDCRLAEQKGEEVRARRAELAAFAERVAALCGGLQASDPEQQQVCRAQQAELSLAQERLQGLARQYAAGCQPTSLPQNIKRGW